MNAATRRLHGVRPEITNRDGHENKHDQNGSPFLACGHSGRTIDDGVHSCRKRHELHTPAHQPQPFLSLSDQYQRGGAWILPQVRHYSRYCLGSWIDSDMPPAQRSSITLVVSSARLRRFIMLNRALTLFNAPGLACGRAMRRGANTSVRPRGSPGLAERRSRPNLLRSRNRQRASPAVGYRG